MNMRSNNTVIKKCVVQRFGVRTPEWTLVVPKSSQDDDPKMQDGPIVAAHDSKMAPR